MGKEVDTLLMIFWVSSTNVVLREEGAKRGGGRGSKIKWPTTPHPFLQFSPYSRSCAVVWMALFSNELNAVFASEASHGQGEGQAHTSFGSWARECEQGQEL
jgi:hypothetical protein